MSPSFSLSSLPDEVALSCMALLPRSDHASLSRVSKRYRSLVASPELYKIRSQLGYSSFYVCLSIHGPNSPPRWFIISREKTVTRVMTPIPPCPSSHPIEGFSVVSIDWGIYVIGGSRKREYTSSSSVLLLDCRSHTWRQVPSMKVARCDAAAGVFNGKIYVLGGCNNNDTFGEVFDPNTQTWDYWSPLPVRKETNMLYRETIVIGGNMLCCPKIRDVNYSRLGIKSCCYCTTEKVLYGCNDYGDVYWCESKDDKWKKVKGLLALHNYFYKPVDELFRGYCRLRSFGTNVLIVWFKYNSKNTDVDIWCAEISFKRGSEMGEIVGEVEWVQAVAGVNRFLFSHIEVLRSAYVNV